MPRGHNSFPGTKYASKSVKMLHEVLFALSGHSGGLFTDNGDGIRVVNDVPFIHPSEVDVLNKFCILGTHYRNFNRFIKKHGGTLSLKIDVEEEIDIHGLYLKAFCLGLDLVLEDYRKTLSKLETDILADPYLPVSHLSFFLQEYYLLFPALSATIEQIVSHKIYVILILHACHRELFKQLSSWLLHGSINDPYKEFFIQRSLREGKETSLASQEEDEDYLGIPGVTGKQLQNRRQFILQAELLPVYISVRVANKILFVGESLQMFESDRKPSSFRKGSILKGREHEFAKDLHEMSKQEEFNAMSFESLIDKIRAHVAEHLWMIVVEDSDLIGHLKIIKDFYLLGRGELFLAFIDQAQSLLRGPPTGTTEHDVNMAFQQAARNVLFNDENLLQRIRVTVPSKTMDKKVSDSTSSGGSTNQSGMIEAGWNCIGLTYTVEWPLHIFFTPSVLEKYNCIFHFLLCIRRAQTDLQQCWTLQMQSKERSISAEENMKWQLRIHMAFLVDNLQYYLQYGILVDKINSTRDFEAVQLAHDQFLSALLSQCFIHMKSVLRCLHEILDQCGAFSRLLAICDSPMSARHLSQLENIAKNFQRQSNLLFKILSSVRSHNASPHLAQLLLRLDFNRYFTIAGGHVRKLLMK
ncbi:hypothetical protein KUTeg_017620 [Tegillarca granosa]|uniref:Gamma-tubulin complex component n=1 Tax=Tegillarca granosa TaxID=220873 RepID=A0ABQ9EJB8_TEGGR|nr:hypothetical protein KUTeg_017620 [Tegillarca granosa]